MKEKGILSRFGIVLLILLALVLILPSARIDLASGIKASTQAGVRVEHIQNFARSAEMDVQLLSADDPAYQQIANVLSSLTCVKRFNQQYSSYSHEYPVDSITVSYYDDAENNNLLFTVWLRRHRHREQPVRKDQNAQRRRGRSVSKAGGDREVKLLPSARCTRCQLPRKGLLYIWRKVFFKPKVVSFRTWHGVSLD